MSVRQTTSSVVLGAHSLSKKGQAVSRPTSTPNVLQHAEYGVTYVLFFALLVAAPIPVILLARTVWLEMSQLNVYQFIDLF